MGKLLILLLILFIATGFVFPQITFAKLGVGVGLGKVQIDEKLTPGGIYKLPSLPVINTGDEKADYEIEVTYLEGQTELRPDSAWFSFNPKHFTLEAGKSQLVEVTLTLPVNARPAAYFAFLEAHPLAKQEGVTIGIAAATKLNFSVKPVGVLGGAVERLRSLLETTRPGTYIALGIVGGLIIIVLASRYLDVRIRLKKTKEEEDKA